MDVRSPGHPATGIISRCGSCGAMINEGGNIIITRNSKHINSGALPNTIYEAMASSIESPIKDSILVKPMAEYVGHATTEMFVLSALCGPCWFMCKLNVASGDCRIDIISDTLYPLNKLYNLEDRRYKNDNQIQEG